MIRESSTERLKVEETGSVDTKNRERILINCFNRGCGQKFDPNDNEDDEACVHHPGQPVFHDAYKGWSCCNKKCTDFTEFLNIKGCTKSRHSNIKPVEAVRPAVDKSKSQEVIEVRSQLSNNQPELGRPPFDTPCILLKPTISPALLEQVKGLTVPSESAADHPHAIAMGQSCKNRSCKSTYHGSHSDDEICHFHPGMPVFHEGMKFWSCCQKRTTDFAAFLVQPGCSEGRHVWTSTNPDKKVNCRMDWYQTGSFVYVSIYAKKYDPNRSSIKLNPIRLMVELFFSEDNSTYNLDIELRGIVDVNESAVNMLPSKVEVKLKKNGIGSWANLEIPRQRKESERSDESGDNNISSRIEAVDISDL